MTTSQTKQRTKTSPTIGTKQNQLEPAPPTQHPGGAQAASICPRCDYHTGTPIFGEDVDGYTLTYVRCHWCGYVS